MHIGTIIHHLRHETRLASVVSILCGQHERVRVAATLAFNNPQLNIQVHVSYKGGVSMIKWLAYIINIVWIKKTIPDDWRRGIILPFWKNKGNKEVCSNHRGITLLSIPGKLFAMILLERIRPTFHNHRRSEQAGFTAGRSTTEQFFCNSSNHRKIKAI